MVTVRCKTSSLRTLVCILLAGYAKSQACSPVTVVTDWTGNLKSPEFPNNYPNNISCSWVLTVSPGNRIEVTTFVLLLDSYSTEDPSCPGDYLEVRQGASRVSPLIGRYCGGSVPPPFVSSSENLFMQFVTDASGSSAGFFLQHKGVCRVQLNETSGTISTPNYPQFYPTSQDCLWSIQVNSLLEITLNITTLDTEHNDNCTFDYVEVYAGVSMGAPLIGRHCGLAEGLSYARRGNLSVRFVSDGDREKMGFLATYTTRLSGTWTEWSPWTPCSVTCHQGNSTRFRMCTDPLPLTDEPYWCQGQESNKTEQIEVRTCVVSNCTPVDGGFTSWSSWSNCSSKCGIGTHNRTRNCTNPAPAFGGSNCSGNTMETGPCDNLCSVNGGYTAWSNWSACPVTCGAGSQARTRNCSNPVPKNGGKDCTSLGPTMELKLCNRPLCPVHGGYSLWSNWTKCSVTCGNGTKSRSRNCTNPGPLHGGNNCTNLGPNNQTIKCDLPACPVNGDYSPWSNWTKCSVTCGNGTKTRLRNCTNPEPLHGGKNCTNLGPNSQTIMCDLQACPINGDYSTWSNWTKCSVTCGNGTKTRSRNCTNPEPLHGGNNCTNLGPNSQTIMCDHQACPINGGYSPWSNWTKCSVTCGNGTKTRSRNCTNPDPLHGGNNCTNLGPNSQTIMCDLQACPINGGYSNWSNWTKCAVTCGNGTKTRSRNCTNPEPLHGGNNCTNLGPNSQTIMCDLQACPINGGYSPWSNWTTCSVTCGNGTKTRSRNCTNHEPLHGGNNCTNLGPKSQTIKCDIQACPINGGYSNWSNWTKCSVTCGNGTKTRSRNCTNPEPLHGGNNCTNLGPNSLTIKCDLQACPINGGYSPWSNWTKCSVTCGNGTKTRSRNCTNPVPLHGGNNCTNLGPNSQTIKCDLQACPINGGYSTWSDWTKCAVTCGNGTKTRSRNCTNPEPLHGGNNCTNLGPNSQTIMCDLQACPINGGYSPWSNWTTCSVTCGNGTKTRSRNCTNPEPLHGGNNCTNLGPNNQTIKCDLQACPINGGYSPWSNWTKCSVTCGNGTKTRSMNCTNPEPLHGGNNCTNLGPNSQTIKCDLQACPINGGYSPWSNWTKCSVTCGNGTKTRSRNCTNPEPLHGGNNCTNLGPNNQTIKCDLQACPINGGYSPWSNWTKCSVTCGNGTKTRSRNCTDPEPLYGGNNCTNLGPNSQIIKCDLQACPINGGYSPWSNWTQCSVTCGNGTKTRSRNCTNPRPLHGGNNCTNLGPNNQTIKCDLPACPVNGDYSPWSNWTKCSVTCGNGTKTRSRNCTEPEPLHGGNNCTLLGPNSQIITCQLQACPVNGGYTAWSNWSECSVECGTGLKNRTRNCTNPEPINNGRNCSELGPSKELSPCSVTCVIDGGYSPWSNWSECSVTCDSGVQNRTRTCTVPKPKNGGKNCSHLGPISEQKACNNSCPVDGGYSAWSKWGNSDTTTDTRTLEIRPSQTVSAPDRTVSSGYRVLQTTDSRSNNSITPLSLEPSNRQTTNLDRMSLAFTDVPQSSTIVLQTSVITKTRASNLLPKSGIPQTTALDPQTSIVTLASNLFLASGVPQSSASEPHKSIITTTRASNLFSISNIPKISSIDPQTSIAIITRASNLFSTRSVPQNSSSGHHTSLVTIYRASNTFSISGVPQSPASGPHSSDITITRASNLFSTSSVPQNSSGHHTLLVTIYRASNTFSISGVPQSSASGPYSSDINITRASNLFSTSSVPQNSSLGHNTSLVTISRASNTFSISGVPQSSASGPYSSDITITRASNLFWMSSLPQNSSSGHYTSVVTIYRASHTFSTRSESQNSSSRHHTSLVTISRASNTFTTSGVPKSSAALLLSDRYLPSKNSTGSSSQKISVTGKFHIVLPTPTAGLLLVSTSLEVNSGIPQGSIKGPFLTIQENGFGTVDLGSSTVNLDYSSAASTYSFNNNRILRS
ncbi:SCO-spondin isoform X3 [Nematostella vectensis]|uniref:SCO-spondin isoform X3 n=1 Tax=Nematostella vectensis TaxID=45351 RepID=UPI00207716E0|nr:SCO-spondin isoform X3 [Nematostella vectensis]